MRVAIRVEASKTIGMGHFIRSGTVADVFQDLGHEVIYLTRSEWVQKNAESNGFKVILLTSDYPKLQTLDGLIVLEEVLSPEVNELKEWIEHLNIEILLIDSYVVNQNYFRQLKQFTACLVYIDDYNDNDFNVDILVNGNISADDRRCAALERPIRLMGTQYNMIRKAFKMRTLRVAKASIEHVLVTTGGTDANSTSLWLLNALLKLPNTSNWTFHVVIGSGYDPELIEQLVRLSHLYPRIICHHQPKDMFSLMSTMDLAISAGGSTLYELAAVGVPTIACIIAENQREIVTTMNNKEYLISIGQIPEISEADLVEAVEKMLDSNTRQSYIHRQQQLVDGLGPSRIVETILQFMRRSHHGNQ